jgi:hypothetical protein
MSLQYKFFIIPIKDLSAAEEAFNHFLRTVAGRWAVDAPIEGSGIFLLGSAPKIVSLIS